MCDRHIHKNTPINFCIPLVDDEANDNAETVVNIVDAHQLQETNFSKKDFMSLVKPYLKKVVEKLKENGKEDRVKGFQQGATEMIKFLVSRFDEMQIFMGQSMEAEAGLCFAYNKDDEIDPTFLFFADGMKEEKF